MSNIDVKTILYTTPREGLEQFSLITLEVNCPYYVWTELLTSKRFARNASSNRALSVSKNIDMLGHYTPDVFYQRGKGMQAGQPIELFSPLDNYCSSQWDRVWNFCTSVAKEMEEVGITKEQASRVLPTFKMMKGLVTGTRDAWNCFLDLRDNPKADNAMQELAKKIRVAVEDTSHELCQIGSMHVPFWKANYYTENAFLIATGRIARISYVTEGMGEEADEKLGKRIIGDGHLSPIEHIAMWNNEIFPSAICSKDRDMYLDNGDYGGCWGWTNLRAWYEEFDKIEGFGKPLILG